MPKLEVYQPHTYGAEPRGEVNPQLRTARLEGEGVEELGRSAMEAGDRLLRSGEQQETTSAVALASQANLDGSKQIEQGLQSGVFDTTKFLSNFDEQTESGANGFQTQAGRDVFQEQMARVKSSLGAKAIAAQMDITNKNTLLNLNQSVNNDALSLQNDPTQFPSIINRQNSAIDSYVKNGSLNFDSAGKEKLRIGNILALAALNGHMETDYKNKIQAAQNMLDTGGMSAIPNVEKYRESLEESGSASKIMSAGAFGKYLSPEDQQEVINRERSMNESIDIELGRRIAATKQAHDETIRNWENNNFDALTQGKLSAKDVNSSPLDPIQRTAFLNLVKRSTALNLSDPMTFNNTFNRTMLPDNDPNKISDPYDVYGLVGHGLSMTDARNIVTRMNHTPEGQEFNFNRRQLLKVAKSQIVKSGIMGQLDPFGQYHYQQFQNDLFRAEDALKKEGKDPRELYDPTSKYYFASPERMSHYSVSSQEAMGELAKQIASQGKSKTENVGNIELQMPMNIGHAPGLGPQTKPPVPGTSNKKIMNFEEWTQSLKGGG